MSWTLVEPLVTAVETYLLTNDAAKVAALNGTLGAPTLSELATAYLGEVDLEMVPTHPAGYVLAADADLRLASLRVGGGELRGTYRLTIGVVDTDQDTTALRLKMMRWARALLEMLVEADDANALGGYTLASGGSVTVTYAPNLQRGSRMFGGVHLGISFFRQEVRP